MKKMKMFAIIEMFIRLTRQLHRESIVMAIEDADLSNYFRTFQCRGEQFHLLTNMGNLLENAAVAIPLMIQNPTVKLLGTDPRLTEEEVKHSTGPTRYELIRKQAHDTGANEGVYLLPIDMPCLLFDHPETSVTIWRTNALFF